MRFHRLVVRDFKGIGQPEPLVFPSSGVLVVEGRNEAGKSSLVEAIDLLFEFKDSSSHRRVIEAHPIGRDEAPYVELEMSTGPYRFVYAKRWARRGESGARGRRGETTLHVLEPQEKRYAGAEAAERATEILAQTLDRPLWDALRLMQATSLPAVSLAGSAQLRAALDAAAGSGVDAGGEGDTILAAAESEYRRYFTAATGKPTGEYDKALRALELARGHKEAAKEAVAEVERHVGRHAEVSIEIEALTARLAEAREKRDALAAQQQEAARLQGLLAAAEEALERARRDESDASTAVAARATLVAEIEKRSAACELAGQSLTELRAAAEARLAAAGWAREQADVAADAAERARAALESARALVEMRALRQERAGLTERLARVDELSEQIARVKGLIASLRVGEGERKRVEAAERVLDRALVAQRSASASVLAEPLAEGVRVSVDDEPIELAQNREWALTEAMAIEVPGVVRLRLQPEAGAGDRAAQVDSARRELQSILRELGVETPAEAFAQADRRSEAEQTRRQVEAAREAVLGGDDLAELRDRAGELELLVAADEGTDRETGRETGSETDTDTSPARVAELAAIEADARGRLVDAREAAEAARADAEAARLEVASAEAEATADRRELGAREDALVAARTEVADDELRRRGTEVSASLALALRERDDLAGQVERAVGQELFDAAERAASAAAQRLRTAETERTRIEAVLEEVGGQGRAERFDESATALDAAEREAAELGRHAEAARMLFETLRRHSDAAKAAYVKPFSAAVQRLGRLVYGSSFGVVVGADLTIEERSLEGVSVPYSSLSTGAKEQLAILVRLACAQLVDVEAGVPVIIDDALGYSDPDRILATTAAFEHVAEQAQVVMLTCTPGRYDGVRGAQTVRLGD